MTAAAASAVAAVLAAALGATPARAVQDAPAVPTPSPSALATVDPTGGSTATATGASAGDAADQGSAFGHLIDDLVSPVLEQLFVTVTDVVTPSGASGSRTSTLPAAGLQPGGGSSTDGRDWHPTAPVQVPKAAKAPAKGRHSAPLSKEQVIWAAYESAARAEAGCHIPVMLLASIGEVESSSLRGRSLDSRHDAVPPVIGPALSGGNHASIGDSDGGSLDGDPVWDHAVGPMQFIPATWRIWGADGNGDGVEDPQNVEDAALAAAHYLCAGGRDLSRPGDLRAAVFSYNHSQRYVNTVLGLVDAVLSGADAGP